MYKCNQHTNNDMHQVVCMFIGYNVQGKIHTSIICNFRRALSKIMCNIVDSIVMGPVFQLGINWHDTWGSLPVIGSLDWDLVDNISSWFIGHCIGLGHETIVVFDKFLHITCVAIITYLFIPHYRVYYHTLGYRQPGMGIPPMIWYRIYILYYIYS